MSYNNKMDPIDPLDPNLVITKKMDPMDPYLVITKKWSDGPYLVTTKKWIQINPNIKFSSFAQHDACLYSP